MKKSIYLIVCAVAFATWAQAKSYNIADYGAVADGSTLNTVAIQKAIDACAKDGGGQVVIPAGRFVTGTVRLYSNINLYFAPGAWLLGAAEEKDYLMQKDNGFEGMGAGNRTGIIFAHKAENVSISGEGNIDGRGTAFMQMGVLQQGGADEYARTRQGVDYMNPKYGTSDGPVMWRGAYEDRPGVMVIFSDCKNVSLQGVRFVEAPNWTVAFLNCDNVKVRSVTIDNNMAIPNSDGLDFYDCCNVTVSDCVINAGDDAIAVVSSDNITVSNSVLHSRSCGVRVGYNVFNQRNSGNLLFNNLRIYDSNRGIGIFQRQQGDLENLVFSNIIIQTRLHTGSWWGHGEPIHISVLPGLGAAETGAIRNVQFNNLIVTGETGMVLYSYKLGRLENVSFNNMSYRMKNGPLAATYGGNFDLRPANDPALGLFKHDTPAIYARGVKGLTFRDVLIGSEARLPEFYSNAFVCENFESVSFENISGKSAITLREGSDVRIEKTDGFIKKENVK